MRGLNKIPLYRLTGFLLFLLRQPLKNVMLDQRSVFSVIAGLTILLSLGCHEDTSQEGFPSISAQEASELDKIFENDDDWLGGDAAYSIPLGGERVLWLFGDSFISTGEQRDRKNSVMVRNSIAIQTGLIVSDARITFYWNNNGQENTPSAFFESGSDLWLWPGHGAMLEKNLILFFFNVWPSDEGLGFELRGFSVTLVENPEDDPTDWKMADLEVPDQNKNIIIGASAVFLHDGYLMAHGVEEPSHDAYLVRWGVEDAENGNLQNMQWYCGDRSWGTDCKPKVLIENLSTEFSVHQDKKSRNWLLVQTVGFGKATIGVRWAKDYLGPWSSPLDVYRPVENEWPQVMLYAGKAHPELNDDGILVTYAVNSSNFETLLTDMDYYFPRFVRLTVDYESTAPQE